MKVKKIIAMCAAVLVVLMPILTLAADTPPALPLLVYGGVKIDGLDAPVGTVVSAQNNGLTIASTTLNTAGRYFMEIAPNNVGATLVYKVGSLTATQAICADPLIIPNVELDLAVVTPVVNNTGSGGGGGGGGGGGSSTTPTPTVVSTPSDDNSSAANPADIMPPTVPELPRGEVLGQKVINNYADFIKEQKTLVKSVDKKLTQRLAGRILLQVQNRGEAWYVEPVSQARFYLADGASAYGALRQFGLGITNKDLSKIPVGVETRFLDTDSDGDGLPDKLEEGLGTDPLKIDTDGDGVSDYDEVMKYHTNPLGAGPLTYDGKLQNRLKGRIVLQVQGRGEAWYIHPVDGRRYYMKDGDAAYQIMRFLSLGITNQDLSKIDIGD